jgi:DNA-binding SARP family transcriptional activator
MARAAVKAKQQAKAKQAQAAPKARARGRRRHASGGNPNQQLFFIRMRKSAKPVYVGLAVVFAVTFAFLGVGSGTNGGLDQLFSNLNIFKKDKASVSAALDNVHKHPNDPAAYRRLATAYQAKGDTTGAIDAYQRLTTIKPKDAQAWGTLGGLQMAQAQQYQQQYQQAYQAQQLAAPSATFKPTGKLGEALGTNPIESGAANQANAATNDLYQRTLLGYQNAVSSYKRLAVLQPKNPNSQFQLASAAQTAGDSKTAVAAYKAYLKLNPGASTAPQIRQLIKQLSPAPVKPKKKSK